MQAAKVTVVQKADGRTRTTPRLSDDDDLGDGGAGASAAAAAAAADGDDMLGRRSAAAATSAERNAEMLRLMHSGGEDGSGMFTAKQVGRFIKVVQANARSKSKEGWKVKIVAAARDERIKSMARAKEHIDRIRALKKGLPAPAPSPASAAEDTPADGVVQASDPSAFMNRGVFGTDDEEREAAYTAMRSGALLTEQQMKIVVATAEDDVTRELQPELDKLMHAARMQARAQAQQELVQKMSRKRTVRQQSQKRTAGTGRKSSAGIVSAQPPQAAATAAAAVVAGGDGGGGSGGGGGDTDEPAVRRRPKKKKAPAVAAAATSDASGASGSGSGAHHRQSYAETDL